MATLVRLVFALLLIFLGSCGPGDSYRAGESQTIQPVTGLLSVQIQMPVPGTYGSTVLIIFQGQNYLLGSKTPLQIRNFIYGLAPGSIQTFQVRGAFEQEKGNLPNPSVFMNVIQIYELH